MGFRKKILYVRKCENIESNKLVLNILFDSKLVLNIVFQS